MDDKIWWHIARSSGLTAWVLVCLTVLWGLFLSTRVLGGKAAPAWLLDLHRGLGALSLTFTGVHLLGLVLDSWLEFGLAELLVPMASSYRSGAVAWGVVALYLLLAISVTSWLRRWIPDRLWRWVHATAFAMFVLTTVHTLTAGTDASGPWVRGFALATCAAFLFLSTYRLLAGRRTTAARTVQARDDAAEVVTPAPPAASQFHPLRVLEIRPEAGDAVSVAFDVPSHLAPTFRFDPGQFLTLRQVVEGRTLRRQYSICSGIADGELRIAVRRVTGGALSGWLVDSLRPGDVVDVQPPAGRFSTTLNPLVRRRVLGAAAGSGVTPVMSILSSILTIEPHSTALLLLGNREPDTVMLRGAIDDLARRSNGRLTVAHLYSRHTPNQPQDAYRGRADHSRLSQPDLAHLRLGEVDEAFVCGPGGFVAGIREHLTAVGIEPDRVRSESFDRVASAPTTGPNAAGPEGLDLVVVHDGRATPVRQRSGETILDAGLRAGLDLPFSCLAGACGTCIARVTSGDADPGAGELSPAERAAGQVLTCQSRALTPRTTVDFTPLQSPPATAADAAAARPGADAARV